MSRSESRSFRSDFGEKSRRRAIHPPSSKEERIAESSRGVGIRITHRHQPKCPTCPSNLNPALTRFYCSNAVVPTQLETSVSKQTDPRVIEKATVERRWLFSLERE